MMTETALGTVRTPLRAEHDPLHERWSVLDADGEMVTCFPYGLSRTPSQAEQLARMLVAGSVVEELREGLKPFAEYAEALGEPWTGDERLHVLNCEPMQAGRKSPKVSDCRRAAELLAKTEPTQQQGG
jgi:hypothetical protein